MNANNEHGLRMSWIVQRGEDGLLRTYLQREKRVSRRTLRHLKWQGQLLVNNQPTTVRHPLQVGDVVELVFPPVSEARALPADPIPIEIIYEDDYVTVLNKAPGRCVHPTYSQKRETLANGLMYEWKKRGYARSFHAVNRLDRHTSGVVVIAHNSHVHHLLARQLQDRLLKRYYVLWVEGTLAPREGIIEKPIGRAPDSIIKRRVDTSGQFARTRYEVMHVQNGYSEVRVELDTGRTHQIRVHMQSLGLPLLGDDLYGGKCQHIFRQALHAYAVQFLHPLNGEVMRIQAPLPTDLRQLLTSIEMPEPVFLERKR